MPCPVATRACAIAVCLALSSCGGGGDDGGAPLPISVGGPGSPPPPTSNPAPPATDPPATNLLPTAPFGLASSADFALIGWQGISQGPEATSISDAEKRGTLAWSAALKTYAIALTDLANGRLVYTFPPSNNSSAFSIIRADGSVARVYVTIIPRTNNISHLYWRSADGVTPYVYAEALFGLPLSGSLPTSGRRVFTTDTSPESAITFDFATRKVSGTLTTFHDGGGWDPAGPKEQATLEPADIQPDGSFEAVITVPGAPAKGTLKGRLYGPGGSELAVAWNAPVRSGWDGAFTDWRSVLYYPLCTSCPG